MKYLALLVLLAFLFPNNVFADQDSLENLLENTREGTGSKISPILLKWQSSENKDQFAKTNGLLYKDGTIQVYVYLTNEEFLSQIKSEINVVASDANIVVAYVSPQQLDTFENLDYVERVTPPELARTPPIPQIVTKEKIEPEEKNDAAIPILVIAIILSSITFSVYLHKKRSKK